MTATCTATSADLCWTRGDSGRLDVTVTQSDGTAYDLTGATLFLTVKNALADADSLAVIRKEVTTHDDAAAGESHFDLLTTDNATTGTRYYDVQLVTDLGDVFTLFGGIWKVLGDVTIRTELPVFNAVIVSGAGSTSSNGTYTARGTLNGKPYYNLLGEATDNDFGDVATGIYWGGSQWSIAFQGGSRYASNNDTAFPWLATFINTGGESPAPTLTAASV